MDWHTFLFLSIFNSPVLVGCLGHIYFNYIAFLFNNISATHQAKTKTLIFTWQYLKIIMIIINLTFNFPRILKSSSMTRLKIVLVKKIVHFNGRLRQLVNITFSSDWICSWPGSLIAVPEAQRKFQCNRKMIVKLTTHVNRYMLRSFIF